MKEVRAALKYREQERQLTRAETRQTHANKAKHMPHATCRTKSSSCCPSIYFTLSARVPHDLASLLSYCLSQHLPFVVLFSDEVPLNCLRIQQKQKKNKKEEEQEEYVTFKKGHKGFSRWAGWYSKAAKGREMVEINEHYDYFELLSIIIVLIIVGLKGNTIEER